MGEIDLATYRRESCSGLRSPPIVNCRAATRSRWSCLLSTPAFAWAVKAGAKHRAERLTERAWCLTLRGGAPGIHHVVTGARGDVWTCRRRAEAAPELIPA